MGLLVMSKVYRAQPPVWKFPGNPEILYMVSDRAIFLQGFRIFERFTYQTGTRYHKNVTRSTHLKLHKLIASKIFQQIIKLEKI